MDCAILVLSVWRAPAPRPPRRAAGAAVTKLWMTTRRLRVVELCLVYISFLFPRFSIFSLIKNVSSFRQRHVTRAGGGTATLPPQERWSIAPTRSSLKTTS